MKIMNSASNYASTQPGFFPLRTVEVQRRVTNSLLQAPVYANVEINRTQNVGLSQGSNQSFVQKLFQFLRSLWPYKRLQRDYHKKSSSLQFRLITVS